MPTDINVSQLIINKLTQAQFDEAKNAGNINDTELYMITDDDSSGGGQSIFIGSYEGHGGETSITTYPNVPEIFIVSGGGNFAALDISTNTGVCISSGDGLQHLNVIYSDYTTYFSDQNGLSILSMPGVTYHYLYTASASNY